MAGSRVEVYMSTHTPSDRATAFDELLWQISGELSMTPASASLAGAPFIDVDPDPSPEPVSTNEPPQLAPPSKPSSRLTRQPARGWLAGGMALALAGAAFFFGTQVTTPPAVETLDLAAAHAQVEFDQDLEQIIETMRTPPPVIIPAALAPMTSATVPEPQLTSPAKAKVTPKRTTRKRTSAKKATTQPKVDFDDL